MNVIPCTTWVRRGVAAAIPDKVQLTPAELETIIKQTEAELQDLKCDSDDDDSSALPQNNATSVTENEFKSESNGMTVDEYDFENYDNEAGNIHCSIAGVAVINADGKDPFVTVDDNDDKDSEKEDDIIKPDDNLIILGHVEGDANILEIFVYNENEGSFYCHHDILLPSFPLCLEWLNFEPSDAKPGNLCAMGSMASVIHVWDLDLVDCLEPAFKLGNKKKKEGHRDAVLDIAWNTNYTHILASGSVDKTILLWDLELLKSVTKLNPFTDRVQALQFHPTETHHLLTGCADNIVRLFDCKAQTKPKSWEASGEVERVLWNHFNLNYCFISTSNGNIECIDVRQGKTLWQVSAHEKEVTGLSLSTSCPGLLVTTSSDEVLKIWDTINPEILEPVFEKKLNLGNLQCLAASPNSPFIFTVGGDNKSHNFKVWDLSELTEVSEKFKGRDLVKLISSSAVSEDVTANDANEMMDVTNDTENMTLTATTSTKFTKKK